MTIAYNIFFFLPQACPILDLIAVSSFEITSPNYPNIYPNMLNCSWTFYSMSGNKMKALIKDFIMEESWNCEWDYFNIYDGPDQQSRLLGKLNLLKCPMLSSIHKKIYIIIYVANMIYICCGSNIIYCQRLSIKSFIRILNTIKHNGMSIRPHSMALCL